MYPVCNSSRSLCCDHNSNTLNISNTVFVNSKSSNNTNARLETPNCPFSSINSAINAVLCRVPTQSRHWIVIIEPGIYREHVLVPPFIDLVGFGQNTIISSLEVIGETTISNLVINSQNQLPLTINALDSTIQFKNVSIISSRDQVLNDDVFIHVIAGTVSFLDCTMLYTTVGGSVSSSFILNAGFVTLLQCRCQFITFTPIGTVILFNSLPNSRLIISSSFITLTLNNPNFIGTVIVFQATSAVIYINTSNITLSLIGRNPSIPIPGISNTLIQAIGSTDAILTNLNINFSPIPLGTAVQANGIALNNISPSVKFIDVNWISTPIPSNLGSFSNLNYSITNASASLITNGGLYTRIITVNQPYIVTDSDHTILVSLPTTITLPNISPSSSGIPASGQEIIIKNISSGIVTIVGSIFDGSPQILNPLQSIQLQNNPTVPTWYVIN